LIGLGHDVATFRDPGTTKLGEAIRDVLLHREDIPIAMTTEMLLYMSARAQLVAEQIKPALDAGKIVLCDRYLLANVVYQGHGGGLDIDTIWQVGFVATTGLQPDLTFIFDVDLPTAMQRVGTTQDRLEKRGQDFFQRLRSGYLVEATRLPRYEIVDASDTPERIHEQIVALWNREVE
jgi:dTMP kinase